MRLHPVCRCVRLGVALVLLAACEAGGGGAADGGRPADAATAADTPAAPDAAPVPDAAPAEDVPALPVPTAAEVIARGAHAAGVRSLTLEDTSRGVMANGTSAAKPTRVLPTEVWYPIAPDPSAPATGRRDAPLATADGPYPLVVYAHGFMTRPQDNAGLAGWLASKGYVVAGPEFPLTNLFTSPANAADVVHQPADVSFVIDSLLAANADPASPFHGAVDPDRIAIVGLSLGAMTVALTGFHPAFRDDRVDAVAAIALPGCFLPPGFFAQRPAPLPLLLVSGTMDAVIRPDENATRAWELAQPPRVAVSIHGGTHTGFADAATILMDRLENPDTVGCNAVGGNESVRVENLAPLLLAFGGEPTVDVVARCHTPCDGASEFPPSLKASLQAELMFLAVGAFLDGWFRDDAAARRFLADPDRGLAQQRADDVSLQVDLGAR
jgi:dienelactone hydrolase